MDSFRSSLSNFFNQESKIKISLTLIASAGIGYIGYVNAKNYFRRRRLLALIAKKRRERDEGVLNLRTQLEKDVNDNILKNRNYIVELGFEDLRQKLQDGQLTAVDVLEAFQWRALEAHKQTNCVCIFLPEARGWAEALDAKYGKGGLEKPPLFGIPFSNKGIKTFLILNFYFGIFIIT